MQKIYDNILDLKDKFDIFIFDAYGVFWNGNEFFNGSKEVMAELVKLGKTVCILSNTTQISNAAQNNYEKRGLFKGINYNYFVTSGEFCRFNLLNNKISFTKNKNPQKYFVFGKQNKQLFENTSYIEVDDIKKADFIYLSAIYISAEEYNDITDDYKKYLVQLKKSTDGSYRTTKIEPILNKINYLVESGLPVLSCNPDYTALEGVINNDEPVSILTQGSITKELLKYNTEIIEFGKPYKEIFEFTLELLSKNNINIEDKSRICMIGDTLRTDIKGANNAGIKSVLCAETGITASEADNNITKLYKLIDEEVVEVDFIIRGISINY